MDVAIEDISGVSPDSEVVALDDGILSRGGVAAGDVLVGLRAWGGGIETTGGGGRFAMGFVAAGVELAPIRPEEALGGAVFMLFCWAELMAALSCE